MKAEDDGMKMDMSGMKDMSDMKGMDMSGMKDNMEMDMAMQGEMSMQGMQRPYWQSVALSALHCGAGCTLADIIGEWFTNYVPVTVAGSQLFGNWVLDFILALMIGVYFQFYAIREMEKISVGNALARAFKADFFSLLSWQVGMYGWMAIVYFVLFINEPLPKDTWIFWFMMQLAMLFGFFCIDPVRVFRGIFGVFTVVFLFFLQPSVSLPCSYLGNIFVRHHSDRKSTRLNSSHIEESRMPSSA